MGTRRAVLRKPRQLQGGGRGPGGRLGRPVGEGNRKATLGGLEDQIGELRPFRRAGVAGRGTRETPWHG